MLQRWMREVRIYPNKAQQKSLALMLRITCNVYNASLQQRRDVYKTRGVSVSFKEQCRQFTDVRNDDPMVKMVYRECATAAIKKLDLAMSAFFRRLKNGEKPGYPRFKPLSRWTQLEFPHGDRALFFSDDQKQLRIPGVGKVRVRKDDREIPEFGRAFLNLKNGRWYAIFECERETQPLSPNDAVVGVDVGVTDIIALSNGQRVVNPKIANTHRSKVERQQRRLDEVSVKSSDGKVLNRKDPVRKKQVLAYGRAKEREANARKDFLRKRAFELVRDYGVIALEKLRIVSMTKSARGKVEKPGKNVAAKSALNRSILDSGWGMFKGFVAEKAEYAARTMVEVDARNTSRTCSSCGHVDRKSRDKKRFLCVSCHFECDADVNAARNIRDRAVARLWPGSVRGRVENSVAVFVTV